MTSLTDGHPGWTNVADSRVDNEMGVEAVTRPVSVFWIGVLLWNNIMDSTVGDTGSRWTFVIIHSVGPTRGPHCTRRLNRGCFVITRAATCLYKSPQYVALHGQQIIRNPTSSLIRNHRNQNRSSKPRGGWRGSPSRTVVCGPGIRSSVSA